MNKQKKNIHKSIPLSENQMEYTFLLKKKRRWWLLLLLILLILFIPLKKDVKIQLIDRKKNNIISDIEVKFEYRKRDIINYDSLSFFSNYYPLPKPAMSSITNKKGIAVFKNVKYSIFQYLSSFIYSKDIGHVFINNNECYNADSIYDFYDLKNKAVQKLYVNPNLIDIQFTVIDKEDNQELPNALVTIVSNEYNYIDSALSDESGRVYFKNVPNCSEIEVIGKKYGWKNDSITRITKEIIRNKKDTLFLEQEKVIIPFYVKDLQTNTPIANAYGYLFFRTAPNTIITSAITNRNGLGKGVFEEIHKIKRIRIDVKKQCYRDSSTINYYVAEDWILKTPQEQTIYIAQTFKNITLYIYKCWNPKKDSYKLYIDGNLITNYRATTANETTGEETQKNKTFITRNITLSCGTHTISLKLLKEGGNGSCGGCTEVAIPNINFSRRADRKHNDPKKNFTWTFNIN